MTCHTFKKFCRAVFKGKEFSQHDFIREQLSLLPLKAMRLLYSVLSVPRPVLPSNLKERSYAELNKKRSQFLALSAGISKGS
jgi:hypothetical protein